MRAIDSTCMQKPRETLPSSLESRASSILPDWVRVSPTNRLTQITSRVEMWSRICQIRQQLPGLEHPPPTQTPYLSTCRVCRVSRSWTRVLTMHKVRYSSPAWCKANTKTFIWTLHPALKFSWIAWRGSRSRKGHSRAQKWQMRARLNQVLRAMAVVQLLGRLTFKEQTLGQSTSTEWRTKIWRASLMTRWKAALLAVQIAIS